MTPKTKKRIRILLIAGVVGFGVLQVFPAKILGIPTQDIGTNPPKRYKLEAPPEVTAILQRSCSLCGHKWLQREDAPAQAESAA